MKPQTSIDTGVESPVTIQEERVDQGSAYHYFGMIGQQHRMTAMQQERYRRSPSDLRTSCWSAPLHKLVLDVASAFTSNATEVT